MISVENRLSGLELNQIRRAGVEAHKDNRQKHQEHGRVHHQDDDRAEAKERHGQADKEQHPQPPENEVDCEGAQNERRDELEHFGGRVGIFGCRKG